MSRPKSGAPPKYRHHKARNLAVVTIDGKDHYLGPYASPESHEKYARLIAERGRPEQTHGSSTTQPVVPSQTKTIGELSRAR